MPAGMDASFTARKAVITDDIMHFFNAINDRLRDEDFFSCGNVFCGEETTSGDFGGEDL
jgi:hypothetical protein